MANTSVIQFAKIEPLTQFGSLMSLSKPFGSLFALDQGQSKAALLIRDSFTSLVAKEL
jgi:hypothetical protein